jgi:DNA-3-methyladenine glycosylase I
LPNLTSSESFAAAMPRCPWAESTELYHHYHDREWGVPVHDDRVMFEFLTLEGAQAGLSWLTILKKDAGIVRNRAKIEATIGNARAFLAVQKGFGSFDRYAWQWVGGAPIQNRWWTMAQVPARTAESDAWSKDLKKRGFKFVGTTILYAHMQATGMVNDHLVTCPRHAELS